MCKRLTILVLVFFLSCTVLGARKSRKRVLRDGFVLGGVDGKLVSGEGEDKWFFEIYSDLSDGKGQVSAGTRIELLTSSALEKVIADMKERGVASYRVWGRVTKYRGGNFIFGIYFLPLSKSERQEQSSDEESQRQVAINEPNDVLAMPDEVMKKLGGSRVVRPAQLKKGLELKQDFILADLVGLVAEGTDEPELVLDALGRNIGQVRFGLLNCGALEQAERMQAVEAEAIRFKVSGIVTSYKGRHYLLLQRAIRAYSHGNF